MEETSRSERTVPALTRASLLLARLQGQCSGSEMILHSTLRRNPKGWQDLVQLRVRNHAVLVLCSNHPQLWPDNPLIG